VISTPESAASSSVFFAMLSALCGMSALEVGTAGDDAASRRAGGFHLRRV